MALTKINNNTLSDITKFKVLQVVQTSKTDSYTTTSTSDTDITGMSVNITPSLSSNKILIMVSLMAGCTDAAIVKLLRGSTVVGSDTGSDGCFAMVRNSASNQTNNYTINFLDTPSTTSQITYKLQVKSTAGVTFSVNRRPSSDFPDGSSQITVMEIGV